MLETGDNVTLHYDDGKGLVESGGWVVVEYSDGLLKVRRPVSRSAKKLAKAAGMKRVKEEPVVVYNLRSTSFFRVDLIGK